MMHLQRGKDGSSSLEKQLAYGNESHTKSFGRLGQSELKSIGSRKSSTQMGLAAAIGKKMQPLPPIEQYNIYSNNAFDTAPASKTLSKSAVKENNLMKSHNSPFTPQIAQKQSQVTASHNDLMQAAPKRERDALVAELYATKSAFRRSQTNQGSQSNLKKA